MKKRAAFILLIFVAVGGVYASALKNGFVWDDTALVLRDPLIRSWRLIPEAFRHFLFIDATASDFYRPLQRVSYTWDYAWFAFAPWGYHLSNVLLHAAAAVALMVFLEKCLARLGVARALEIAAAVGVLWAVHPLHTSAVCYVSGRADLLAALFGFAGLYFSLERSWRAGAAAALCFLAALLSKESGIASLSIALILALSRGERPWRLLSFGTLAVAIYCLLRFSAEHQTPPPPQEMISMAARPIVALRAWAEYAGLLVAPIHLHMERTVLPFGRGDFAETLRMARWRELQTLLGAVLLGAFVFWMRWTRRRERGAFVLLLAAVAAYLPISNLLPLNASVAEHWLYFPSGFLIAAAALSLGHLPLSPLFKKTLLLVWLIFLGGRTFTRNFDWRDQRTFLESTIADGGNSARMLMNLGLLESAQGHQKIAIGHFQNALALAPGQPFALLGLGVAAMRANDFVTARAQFEKAAENPFVLADAVLQMAVADLRRTGVHRVELVEKAAQLAPRRWSIERVYIGELSDSGQTAKAIAQLREFLAGQPFYGEAWRMMGDLWLRAGLPDSARRAYERACALDVHDDAARRQLQALS